MHAMRRCVVAVAVIVGLVAVPAGASASPDPVWGNLEAKAARDGMVPVIVELASTGLPVAAGIVREALYRELDGTGISTMKESDELPFLALHADAAAIRVLRGSKLVAGISEDAEVPLDVEPVADEGTPVEDAPLPGGPDDDEPSGGGVQGTSSNENLPDNWNFYRVGAGTTWNKGWKGTGQTVAVLDTGVDRNHSWLQGKVVYEACFSTLRPGYSGGHCPNGNWYQYGTGAAQPCVRFTADCAHGTHVAQTAAGTYNGIAPNAGIIAVQVFHGAGSQATFYESDLLWGLKTVYDLRGRYRIAAVNLSLGGGGYTGYCDGASFGDGTAGAKALYQWIAALRSAGITTVVASGNDNYRNALGNPACKSNVLSVGNTTLDANRYDAVYGNKWDGRRYWGSNSASFLRVIAPGTHICSAIPGNRYNCNYTGTSMAAPHVTGAIAVLRQYRPSASVATMQSALQGSGPSVRDSRNNIAKTRINVWNALRSL